MVLFETEKCFVIGAGGRVNDRDLPARRRFSRSTRSGRFAKSLLGSRGAQIEVQIVTGFPTARRPVLRLLGEPAENEVIAQNWYQFGTSPNWSQFASSF